MNAQIVVVGGDGTEKPNVIMRRKAVPTKCGNIRVGRTYAATRHRASMPTQIRTIPMLFRLVFCLSCCCCSHNLCNTLRHSLCVCVQCVQRFHYSVFTVSIRLLIISFRFAFFLFLCSKFIFQCDARLFDIECTAFFSFFFLLGIARFSFVLCQKKEVRVRIRACSYTLLRTKIMIYLFFYEFDIWPDANFNQIKFVRRVRARALPHRPVGQRAVAFTLAAHT